MICSQQPRLTLDSFCALLTHLRAKHCQLKVANSTWCQWKQNDGIFIEKKTWKTLFETPKMSFSSIG